MLSVAIHKDIAEYQPKVIGKLSAAPRWRDCFYRSFK